MTLKHRVPLIYDASWRFTCRDISGYYLHYFRWGHKFNKIYTKSLTTAETGNNACKKSVVSIELVDCLLWDRIYAGTVIVTSWCQIYTAAVLERLEASSNIFSLLRALRPHTRGYWEQISGNMNRIFFSNTFSLVVYKMVTAFLFGFYKLI